MFSNLFRTNLLSRMKDSSIVASVYSNVKCLHVSSVLCAEPLKKKKKLDPQIVRLREQRKRRKLEKAIRMLKRHGKKLKPIDEMEVSPALQKEIGLRRRTVAVPEQVASFRDDLIRVWNCVRTEQCREDARAMEAMVDCQNAALEELRLTNSELFDAAVQPDEELLPFKISALTETPPIKNFEAVDGKYTDVSRKWRP